MGFEPMPLARMAPKATALTTRPKMLGRSTVHSSFKVLVQTVSYVFTDSTLLVMDYQLFLKKTT